MIDHTAVISKIHELQYIFENNVRDEQVIIGLVLLIVITLILGRMYEQKMDKEREELVDYAISVIKENQQQERAKQKKTPKKQNTRKPTPQKQYVQNVYRNDIDETSPPITESQRQPVDQQYNPCQDFFQGFLEYYPPTMPWY